MNKPFSPLARVYWSEVLGLKQYLCPHSVYALRFIRGGAFSKVLTVVFSPLSLSQKQMLKKIMASVDIFSFSVLEIKTGAGLNQLMFFKEHLADLVCIFGGEDLIEAGHLIEQYGGRLVSPTQKTFVKKMWFLQFCSLEDLEEGSPLIIKQRKRQIWQKLKNWSRLS